MKRKRLTYQNIVTTITKICQKYRIKLVLNDPQVGKDNGYAYDSDEIHLGRVYTNNYILLAIFLHELGHSVLARRHSKKYRKLSIFREETLAWVLAMEF
jgi:thiamine monophosphate synthase